MGKNSEQEFHEAALDAVLRLQGEYGVSDMSVLHFMLWEASQCVIECPATVIEAMLGYACHPLRSALNNTEDQAVVLGRVRKAVSAFNMQAQKLVDPGLVRPSWQRRSYRDGHGVERLMS